MNLRNLTIVFLLICCIALMFTVAPPEKAGAQGVGDQITRQMRLVNQGVGNQGSGILQTGDLSNLSSAFSGTTLTQAVAAPSSGSTYIRGVVVEKSTGAGGTFTIQTGTGTNCGTGTTVLLGPVTNPPIQQYYLGILAPAGKAVCLQTDAATTVVRLQFS
ncbi:MAG TPA: hypothetical protein VJW20_20255 [Candidatus Angelobacter sp.]|nr:hypothetical protein [Candidatus Angelobacter sp.]